MDVIDIIRGPVILLATRGPPDTNRKHFIFYMITCYLRYIIEPHKLTEFETYARMWLPLVKRFGGEHHGYFLPHEGANNIAVALFSFPSLTAYEDYRIRSQTDPDCLAAYAFEQANKSIISYERIFMRPVLD